MFARDQFSPRTTGGQRLLAHELTHVVQQVHRPGDGGSAGTSGGMNIDSTGGPTLSRFPSPVSFGTHEPGLSIMPPVIKEGYDGTAYTAIKLELGPQLVGATLACL